jgi:hypothetical protein
MNWKLGHYFHLPGNFVKGSHGLLVEIGQVDFLKDGMKYLAFIDEQKCVFALFLFEKLIKIESLNLPIGLLHPAIILTIFNSLLIPFENLFVGLLQGFEISVVVHDVFDL